MLILANRLRILRQEASATQKVVADCVGISERSYIRLENNQFSPSVESLIKLADFYDVSIDYLTGRNDNPQSHKVE